MSHGVSACELNKMIYDGGELAVVDVREYGEHGAHHLLFCTPIPYSRFDLDLPKLVPNLSVRLVIYDHGDGPVAARSVAIAQKLGYRNVARLEGGIQEWVTRGYGVFSGVHVPSKVFGELVAHTFGTPTISADELMEKQKRGEPVTVLDGRSWEEYRTMNIPSSISCPNGELVCRVVDLVSDNETPIVINCAGRTRSIIGCETLRQLGIENPIYALRNGTMGWRLASLTLEHGGNRRCHVGKPNAALSKFRRRALQLAESVGASRQTSEKIRAWLADSSRTTYLLDVRDPLEYQEEHLAGAVSAPGGQLLQATETWVGVRRARLVLVDDTELRAAMTAFWMVQMGYEVAILAGGSDAWWSTAREEGGPTSQPISNVPYISVTSLAKEFAAASPPLLLDCQPSMAYREEHVPGALWVIRPHLEKVVAGQDPSIAIRVIGSANCADELIVRDLIQLGFRDVAILEGGIAGWRAASLPVVSSPNIPSDCDCVDYLFFTHDRHNGNLEAARQYLAWEKGLISSLTPNEREQFTLSAPLSL